MPIKEVGPGLPHGSSPSAEGSREDENGRIALTHVHPSALVLRIIQDSEARQDLRYWAMAWGEEGHAQ